MNLFLIFVVMLFVLNVPYSFSRPLDVTNLAAQPNPNKPMPSDSQAILGLIENQMSLIERQDFRGAYDNYTALPFRQATTFDQFKFFFISYPSFTHNKNAIFGNLEYKDHVASMQGTLTSTDGKVIKVIYYFIKEGSLWKIIGIQILRTDVPPGPNPEFAPPYDFQSDIN